MKTPFKVIIIIFSIIGTIGLVKALNIPFPLINHISSDIAGNGNVISKTRSIESFNEINVSSGIDLYIKKDAEETLEVVADENLQDIIITEVKNRVLNIYLKTSVIKSKSLKVNVSFKELKKINATDGSDVFSTGSIQLQDLSVEMNKGSDLKMDCQIVNMICYLKGGSDAKLSGNIENCFITNTRGSDFYGENLSISKCTINSSGGSDAEINVKVELTAEASDGSDIHFNGNPLINKSVTSGASDIYRD